MAHDSQRAGGTRKAATAEALPADVVEGTSPRHRWRKRQGLSALVIVLLGLTIPYGVQLWTYYQTHTSTDDAYVVGEIIPISAQVSGTIIQVQIVDHQRIEPGQVLAQLDTRDFEVRVKQAEAAVAVAAANLQRAEIEVPMMQAHTTSETARSSAMLHAAEIAIREAQHGRAEAAAHLRTMEAAVAAAQAEIDAAAARLDNSRMESGRLQALLRDGVVAHQQFDMAATALKTAEATWRASQQRFVQAQAEVERVRIDLQTRQQAVERTRARASEAQAALAGSQAQHQNVNVKQAQVLTARAMLQQAQADLESATLQLSYTTLRSPLAGTVARKRLEVGQVVQAGRPLLAIVPLENVWIEANFKETQLRHMHPGQLATLRVDAYPDAVFTGTVESISPGTGAVFSLLPPENATGNFVKVVQRVPVKIRLDAAAAAQAVLRPGMSVIATVTIR